MNNYPIFSIIVPVYNVERYLNECLDSIISQSFTNYELLIIDDGSTDKSGHICDTYSIYKNVKVFHKDNGGLSTARNYGIKKAIGEYILFIDSDDFWNDKFFLEKVNAKIEQFNPDLVIFGYEKLYEDGTRKKYSPIIKGENIHDIKYVLEKGDFRIGACDKIIRRNIITNNNITFHQGVIAEDMEWSAKLYTYSDNAVVLYNSSYIYRQRDGSITKVISEKNISDVVYNLKKCLELKEILTKEKMFPYEIFLGKSLSMLIILLSFLKRRAQKKYYPFVKDNIHLLYKGNIREKIIFFSYKTLGIYTTVVLLSVLRKIIR
ncbi:glycosyltransferase family 2 protein [Avibacterium gallinarum]|uniref:glycosyltransferase family 2 protein n=1 Tax=Avibacterium gallinarum TaxID=755 RepID=UPI003BF7927F